MEEMPNSLFWDPQIIMVMNSRLPWGYSSKSLKYRKKDVVLLDIGNSKLVRKVF